MDIDNTPKGAQEINNAIPVTPPATSLPTSGAVDITAILNCVKITSSQNGRRIFRFERDEASPAPEAGPSSRPVSVPTVVDQDSDLESLPDLLRRVRPSTPSNSIVTAEVKISSSQRKVDVKGRSRSVAGRLQTDSDSDIDFVGFKHLSPRQNAISPRGEFPASQAILNSARRDSATPEEPFTPRKRERKRRARPSACQVQGKYALAEDNALISLSPSARKGVGDSLPCLDTSEPEASRFSDLSFHIGSSTGPLGRHLVDSPVPPDKSLPPSTSRPHIPRLAPMSLLPTSMADVFTTSTAGDEFPCALCDPGLQSYSDPITELGSASPCPSPASPCPDKATMQEALVEMTMNDGPPGMFHRIPNPPTPPADFGQWSNEAKFEVYPAPTMPLASLDVDAADGNSRSTSPRHINGIVARSSQSRLDLNSLQLPHNQNSDPDILHSSAHFEAEANHFCVSSDSEGDSDCASPLRRRDVLIISESQCAQRNQSSNENRQQVTANSELRPLSGSADSSTSQKPERKRFKRADLVRTGKKYKARKREELQHVWQRHRDAIVWTGRETNGEFPYEELKIIRMSYKDSLHLDNYNRARFESLVNDQLAKEEPRAPRVRVKDPSSQHSCPPFDFVYTNRLVYRDKVPRPTKAAGCNCVDGCRPDSPDCKCLKRQVRWTRTFPQGANFQGGFAYDMKGRLILPEEIPIVECNSSCGCPADCMNRQVSNGRRYALDLIRTAQKGWGVEAAADRPSIRKGSFLCIYSGEVITWQEAERRGLENDDQANPTSYLFDIDASFIRRTLRAFEQDGFQIIGDVIGDATLPANSSPQAVESQTERYEMKQSLYTVDAMHFGNIGRFFNHACSPNAYLRAVFCDDADEFKPILAVFAKKKIYPGEEITISYRGGDVEGASEDHDSSTDEDGHGINGVLTPCRMSATNVRNQKRRKRSWRMQNGGVRPKSKGGKIKKAGGKVKQAGRLNPQVAPGNFTVATQQCRCGAINCDGYMFQISEISEGPAGA